MVRCEHVSRLYRQGTVEVSALRDVSMALEPGEVACVLGRSGSGKSTLLHVLGCLDRPTRGQVFLGGVDVATLSEPERVKVRRTKLGFVFQSLNLLPSMTAEENVALPLRYAGVAASARRVRARALLERVGLGQRFDFLPQQLSGGEQQRVALARALVAEPLLVLADEPTGELDTATAADVAALIGDVNRQFGTTFLIVTHDEQLARTAGRVLHMQDGCLSEA